MLCEVCLNPKRKPRFNSCRITVCQWCVSELTKDREDSPQTAINALRLHYETEQVNQIRFLKFEADSPIAPPKYPEQELQQALLYALQEAKSSESLLTSVYRSLIDDYSRREEAKNITARMQQEIIARYEENVQAYNGKLIRKEEAKKEYLSLEASLSKRVDGYMTRYLASLSSYDQLKSKRNRLIRAFQLGLINPEKVILNRLGEEENERFRNFIKSEDGHACVICQKSSAQSELHVHHIIPLSKYGTNQPVNHVTLCYSCHKKQHSAFEISRKKSANPSPRKSTFIAVAIKTTGDPNQQRIYGQDEIYEIGAALFENGAVVNKFHSLMYTERYLPNRSAEFGTGINKYKIEKSDKPNEVFPRFMTFIGKSNLVIHDANYVMHFLQKYANSFNVTISNNVTDTLAIARKKLPQLNDHNLLTLTSYLKLKKTATHSAVDSSILSGLALFRLANIKEEKPPQPLRRNTAKENSTNYPRSTKKSAVRPHSGADSIVIASGYYRENASGIRGKKIAKTVVNLPTLTGQEGLDDAFNEYKQENYKTAFQIYRNLARQGVVIAQFNLGIMYENGYGIDKHLKHAVYCYQKAAEQGDAEAQNNLGCMYELGRGVDQDYGQALFWYRKADEQRSAVAQNNLGCMCHAGRGVDQDYGQALFWYRKAAEQGNTAAQNNLGLMYSKGQGIFQDYAQAVMWYRKAAEQGDAVAQNKLGLMYELGRGVEQSYLQAIIWYRKAAEQGNTAAQNNLEKLDKNDLLIDEYHDALAYGDKETALIYYKQLWEHNCLEFNKKIKNSDSAFIDPTKNILIPTKDQSYETILNSYHEAVAYGDLVEAHSHYLKLHEHNYGEFQFRFKNKTEENQASYKLFDVIRNSQPSKALTYDDQMIDQYLEALAYGDVDQAGLLYKQLIAKQFADLFR
ncbi:MAG: exonuclease domain-containing protein [Methylomicrobium sp.]